MNACELLQLFSQNSIEIRVLDGNLKIQAPPGFLTASLKENIKSEKAALIQLIRRQRIEKLPRDPGSSRMLTSFAQRRMWFLDQFQVQNAVYNVPILARISGDINVENLRLAVVEIVSRHEVLRTTFDSLGGEL
jgi:hypothetical protein